jgi:SAM-dependent methyltransferase
MEQPMTADDPHVLRTTFDDSPQQYDRARPVAPPQVFDDLVALARLTPGTSLLEIGCGTGQATLPLAERGLRIVAVELGAQLADFTRCRLRRYEGVRVVTSSFEDWDPRGERFDAVVSFNASHWIDSDVRFAKPAEVLRPGGAVAIVEMRFVTPDDADPTWVALQEDYAAIRGSGPPDDPPLHPDAVEDRWSAVIEDSGFFDNVTTRRHLWTVTYTAGDYVALLGTSSWHRRLEPAARRELFVRIHRRIQAAPDRTLEAPLLASLYVAQRA